MVICTSAQCFKEKFRYFHPKWQSATSRRKLLLRCQQVRNRISRRRLKEESSGNQTVYGQVLSAALSVVSQRAANWKESYDLAVGQRSLYNVRKGSGN